MLFKKSNTQKTTTQPTQPTSNDSKRIIAEDGTVFQETELQDTIKQNNKKKKKDKKDKVSNGPAKKVKNKIGTTEFLLEKSLNKITKGALDNQESDFEFGSQMIMSMTHKKRVLQIIGLPEFVRPAYLENITKIIKDSAPPSEVDKLQVSLYEHCLPYKISMADKKVKGAERRLRTMISGLNQEIAKQQLLINTGTNIKTSRESVDLLQAEKVKLDRKLYSFTHINRVMRKKNALMRTFIFIEVTHPDAEILTDTVRNAVGILTKSGYKVKDILDLEQYLKEFGLASLNPTLRPRTLALPVTTTTKLSGMSSEYSQGTVRTPTADVYIGHEITQNYPAYISYSESADKHIEIILADSSGGKSTMAGTRALFALMHQCKTYRQVARDYKGEEALTKIARLVETGKEVSMSVMNPVFINTFAIPENPMKYGLTEREMFRICYAYTVLMITVLSGAGEKDVNSLIKADLESVANDIVEAAYMSVGVKMEEIGTYHYSREVDFRAVMWQNILGVTANSGMFKEKYKEKQELLNSVRTQLQAYFANSGGKNYLFSNPLDIDKLMDSNYVAFNYATKTGAGDTVLTPKEKIFRNLQETFFVRLFAGSNYLQGKQTIYWIDDLQEQLDNTIGVKNLKEILSVGRSIGIKPILITNELDELLHSENTEVQALKSHISIITIGRIKDNIARDLLEYAGYMEAYYKSKEVFQGLGEYRFSFLNVYNTGGEYNACITKVMLPKHILDSPIFANMVLDKQSI